jgi:GNAT superfamily N-acetyltransferase
MITLVPRTYTFTITHQPDANYLKYLRRKLNVMHAAHTPEATSTTLRLDISLDDPDGDVVAGVAAWTCEDTLMIDLLWVEDSLRGRGIGRHLMQMAEEIALKRGCQQAYVVHTPSARFYQKLGYRIAARLVQFPTGEVFYRLHKPLGQPQVNDLNTHHPQHFSRITIRYAAE